jgi:hypothetical protein
MTEAEKAEFEAKFQTIYEMLTEIYDMGTNINQVRRERKVAAHSTNKEQG